MKSKTISDYISLKVSKKSSAVRQAQAPSPAVGGIEGMQGHGSTKLTVLSLSKENPEEYRMSRLWRDRGNLMINPQLKGCAYRCGRMSEMQGPSSEEYRRSRLWRDRGN